MLKIFKLIFTAMYFSKPITKKKGFKLYCNVKWLKLKAEFEEKYL